jgi:hypothetical protein
MSDAVVTPADGASVSIDPAANPPAPAGTPAAKQSTSSEGEPAWLAPRLERERAKVLKDLGVESPEDAKKAIEAARAAAEAQKSDAQKRGELESTLKAERAEKQAMAAALDAYAKSQMGALTEAQRNAVAAVAGEDPAKQLKTIEALKPTWTGAAAPAAPAAPPPVRDTATAPAAPKEGATSAPPDAKAIHDELQKSNPILAARYALANGLFENK